MTLSRDGRGKRKGKQADGDDVEVFEKESWCFDFRLQSIGRQSDSKYRAPVSQPRPSIQFHLEFNSRGPSLARAVQGDSPKTQR